MSTPSDDQRQALIALSVLCEPGNAQLGELLAAHDPVEVLARLSDSDSGSDSALSRAVTERLAGRDISTMLQPLFEAAASCDARAITALDQDWPIRVNDLAEVYDEADRHTYPPLCLWLRGPGSLAQAVEKSVAIVGARACTSYGRHCATELAYGLAEHGWTVVSGGAYGIDEAAHRGALAANGTTVSVLACGVNRPYPVSNTGLFDQIGRSGLLVSEWPPGAIPQRHRFLVRNRVIAALTLGTVVVEAALRSGARQTARRAWELERPVMIVPGPITSGASAGVHQLARGPGEVRIVTRAAEIIEDLGRIGVDLAPPLRTPDRPGDNLPPLATRVLDAVPRHRRAPAARIAAQAGVTTAQAVRALPDLVGRGLLSCVEGGYKLAD